MMILISAMAVSGCSSKESTEEAEIQNAERKVFAMDTYMTIETYGNECEEAADAAVEEIKRLDELFSIGNEDSVVSKLNVNVSLEVDEETKYVIEMARRISEATDGAFDITIYPVMALWGFTREGFHVPDDEELELILPNVDYSRIVVEGNTVSLGQDQMIELGGIVKGYTSDRVMEIFADYDIISGSVSLGGNVQVYKEKPDGTLWNCAIVDPNDPETRSVFMGKVSVSDCAVITSGAYERYFKDDEGNIYHHIIDPQTGYPAESGLISVSIVSPSGIVADGLSTACYVMGLEKAEEYWKTSEFDFEMILMDENGDVYITEGLEDSFKTNYTINVIRKN